MTVPEKELAPCPFCGSAATYVRLGTERVSCQVECTMCGCFLETGETWNSGNAWNIRTPRKPSAEQIRQVAGAFKEMAENPGFNNLDCEEVATVLLAVAERFDGTHV